MFFINTFLLHFYCNKINFYRASPTSQFDDYIRISFAHYEVEALASGVEKVAQVANSMLLESQ